MYEAQTYEAILQRMLDRVPNNVDKREGSLIWNALSPAAAELAQMYIELDINNNLSFVDTATGDDLTRLCAEEGVNRKRATKAMRIGEFFDASNNPMDVTIGSRFNIENVNYVAIKKIATGVFEMECEQAGIIGNHKFGNLIPIQNIVGLARAELTDVLVPGEAEESDESLRDRYYEEVNNPAFGGNVAQYKKLVNGIDGVGATKVFPVWDGAGTVKCTIIASDWNEPSPTLISTVQEIIDPTPQGQGLGLAPIDHTVTIAGVTSQTIDVVTTVTLQSGVTPGQVQGPIESVIENYLADIRKGWADGDQIIVRVALIESAILTVQGVIDVTGTTLNGNHANVTLGQEEIPIKGSVTVNV